MARPLGFGSRRDGIANRAQRQTWPSRAAPQPAGVSQAPAGRRSVRTHPQRSQRCLYKKYPRANGAVAMGGDGGGGAVSAWAPEGCAGRRAPARGGATGGARGAKNARPLFSGASVAAAAPQLGAAAQPRRRSLRRATVTACARACRAAGGAGGRKGADCWPTLSVSTAL